MLCAINLLDFYDRQILAAVTEPIRHEWSLSDSEVGWLGTAFALFVQRSVYRLDDGQILAREQKY